MARLEVRPGITGLWQVSGRSELPFDDYVRLDLFYIENWSLAYDLFILAKTVPTLVTARGATSVSGAPPCTRPSGRASRPRAPFGRRQQVSHLASTAARRAPSRSAR